MVKRSIFMPIVEVAEDGSIAVDWGDSYVHTEDESGAEVDDTTEMSDLLDGRLRQIRSMLTGGTLAVHETDKPTVTIWGLIRPFFEEA